MGPPDGPQNWTAWRAVAPKNGGHGRTFEPSQGGKRGGVGLHERGLAFFCATSSGSRSPAGMVPTLTRQRSLHRRSHCLRVLPTRDTTPRAWATFSMFFGCLTELTIAVWGASPLVKFCCSTQAYNLYSAKYFVACLRTLGHCRKRSLSDVISALSARWLHQVANCFSKA